MVVDVVIRCGGEGRVSFGVLGGEDFGVSW